MVYRLYLETVKKNNEIAWAYTFYNHQDFLVYKRAGITCESSEEQVILEQSAIALQYFESCMRRRYYDEHFSTRIDEDYVTLYTPLKDIVNAANIIKEDDPNKSDSIGNGDMWHKLIPFFKQKTMAFEVSIEERFINAARELANKQFEK